MAHSIGAVTIDGKKLMATVNIRIRMPRLLRARFWAATKLLALAAWVSGASVSVECADLGEGEGQN